MAEKSQAHFGETFDFPCKLFKKRFGFGIDFGSSIIKVVYTTEEEDNIRIHTVNFSRQLLQEALNFLKTICDGKLEPGGSYQTAGVGVGEHLQEIESVLNIKCCLTTEFEPMLTAFTFLANNQAWESFIYPSCPEARDKGAANAKAMAEIQPIMFPQIHWENLQFCDDDSSSQTGNGCAVQYPVILALVGSGHYLMKIDPDRKSKYLDNYTIAGKTLLGLGSLMTGVKDYSKIMELAASGNATELDLNLDKAGASGEDEVYNSLNKCNIKLFSFGLADQISGDPKKEDIAAALRSMISNSVAQDAFTWSMLEDVHQVFFVGGVVANDEIIRREIEQEFRTKRYFNAKRHACDCLFVKAGGHLSALGTLFANLEII